MGQKRVGAAASPTNELHAAADEAQRREKMWQDLLDRGGPERVPPQVLRDLRIYGGAQGVWVDAETTRHIVRGSRGIAVGLLHTGRHYPDAMDEHGVIYHYPTTNRSPGRDQSEVDAIRLAGTLLLPMFFIAHSPGGTRTVRRTWFVEDDPAERTFYLTFHQEDAGAVVEKPPLTDIDFSLTDEKSDPKGKTSARQRQGQTRFRFNVFVRYGGACVVCGLAVAQLLEAAHLKARAKKGTNDPRNGLPLCRNHHRAFDAKLFGIDPNTMHIVTHESGPSTEELGIDPTLLFDLPARPHRLALEWAWKLFKKKQ
jgi:putative restriction endonuclease